MAEPTESKESELNTFKDGIDSKTVEKEAINTERNEDNENHLTASKTVEKEAINTERNEDNENHLTAPKTVEKEAINTERNEDNENHLTASKTVEKEAINAERNDDNENSHTASKIVEKEAINAERNEDNENSLTASLTLEIDEEIAQLQAGAITAVANSLENSFDLSTGEMKQNNLEIETALRGTVRKDSNEATVRDVPDRFSRTECKLAAYFAKETAKDAHSVIAMGEDLMEKISSVLQVLKSHINKFEAKVVEANGHDTERAFSVANYYNTMASKYEAAIAALEKKYLNVAIVLERLKECEDECTKFAALAEEVTDETLDESRKTKFSACRWNNKGQSVVIVALKKVRAGIFTMGRIWNTVQNDKEYEELNNRPVEDSSDEETQQCENRERKTKIGHIVGTLLGLALISITVLFKVGSDSFYAILILGLLTLVWCSGYWSVKLYKCLKEKDEETPIATERPEQDEFIEDCNRRLATIDNYFLKYNVVINPLVESDTGSEITASDDLSW